MAVVLIGSLPVGSAAVASASQSLKARAAARSVTGGSSAFDWTTLHRGPQRQGYASNSPLTTANAPQLGVAWATNLYAAGLDSPAVYYDSALGKTIAFIGTEHGDLMAINVANGQIIWSTWLGSPIRSTPIVTGGAVFAGTFDSPTIYKLNASTGAIECSAAAPNQIEGSPVAATPPGGTATVYFNTNDTSTTSGPLIAVNASNCSIEWSFSGYASTAGSWDPVSYAVDATGEPLVLLGTADPDSSVYAVDAVTGKLVWRFAAYNPPPGVYDVGAGITISTPKVNGFSGGVAYVPTKYGIMYALDLTTGAQIWSFNYNQALKVSEGGVSTAALDGKNLVVGYHGGLIDINAVTGALLWSNKNPANTEVDSSPAIAGPAGSEVVAVGDLAGGFEVDSLATGAQLYHYQTGNYITASPAVADGNILIASADGFLYDFATGGGNESPLPSTVISSPADSSSIANPGGNLTVTGMATDQSGVAGVVVAVQEGGTDGLWWDAASSHWSSGPIGNAATISAPAATSSGWTFTYPVPPAGGAYQVIAYTVSSTGQPDIKGAHTVFTVRASSTAPNLTANPTFVPPGQSTAVTGGGFAPAESVTVSLSGKTLATLTASSKGTIPSTQIKIPASAPFGLTSLTASGQTSGDTATAAITVANNWAESGYNSSHSGFEPNDSVFYNNVSPGGEIFLDLSWLYQTGAPVDAAPAVARTVAYVANSAGQLVALDVHKGAPLWTWKIPSGVALNGSPAVDPVKNLVFVGATDGTLNAISAVTGKLVWSDTIGGTVSAPVFGSGDVYVTSSSGTVEAVAEATGAKVWSASMPAGTTSAPALDTTNSTVVVGDSSGSLTALNSATGASKWAFASGGALGTATIYGGVVYVASGDSVDAVSESNGTEIWSHATGGAVADTLSVVNQGTHGVLTVFAGSGDGNVYALQASNGAVSWQLPVGHPVVGLATVYSVVVFVTSTGMIGAGRTWEALQVWKYQTSGGISAPPAIVDGSVYVPGEDWNLYAFTTYGQPPAARRT